MEDDSWYVACLIIYVEIKDEQLLPHSIKRIGSLLSLACWFALVLVEILWFHLKDLLWFCNCGRFYLADYVNNCNYCKLATMAKLGGCWAYSRHTTNKKYTILFRKMHHTYFLLMLYESLDKNIVVIANSSNGTSSPSKSWVEGEIVGTRATWCVQNLPIKKNLLW